MAAIFKPTYSRLVPQDAKIIVRKGERFAQFKGQDGRKVTAQIVVNRKNTDDERERCLISAGCWYYKFNVGGKEFKGKGYTDKEATRQLAARLQREASFEHGAGVVDPFKEHRKRPLSAHLEDYSQYLSDKGRNANYVQTTVQRIRDLLEGCKLAMVSDISASKVQRYLGQLRDSGLSIASSNHYLTAIKMFVNWMVKDRRTPDNPIAGMSKQNVETDRRRVRRPLEWDEFDRVLRAAAASDEIQGISGPDRVILYVVACYTGFRRNEIGSVTRGSFDFESSSPTLTVEAGYSKRKRRDVIPLREDFAKLISNWLDNRSDSNDDQPLFNVAGKRTAEMLRKDLGTARLGWLKESKTNAECKQREESSYLCYQDGDGRYADFHALRKTFITNLSKAGVSPKLAQTLARHSDINLTMNTYTSLEINDQSAAVEDLPAIPQIRTDGQSVARLKATGTDDATSRGGQKDGEPLVPVLVQASDVQSHAEASRGTETANDAHNQEMRKPLNCKDFRVACHSEASSDISTRARTRTGTSLRTLDFESDDASSEVGVSKDLDRESKVACTSTCTDTANLDKVVLAWPSLPAQVREAIVTLVSQCSFENS